MNKINCYIITFSKYWIYFVIACSNLIQSKDRNWKIWL